MGIDPNIPNLREPAERCATCPIRNRAVCSYSSPQELTALDEIKFYKDYEPGQTIVDEGAPITSVGSVVSGVAALFKMLEDGRRQMVGLLFPSDFIGRPLRETAPYEAVAVTPVRMCLFHRKAFETVLVKSSALERRLLEMTLDELDAARDWMLLLGRKSAQERVASFLIILAQRHAALGKRRPDSGMTVPVPLTREAIAEFLGLTIETVSRQFTALRKAGVLEIPDRRTVVIADLPSLAEIAGQDSFDPGGPLA